MRITDTVFLQLFRICVEALGIKYGVAPLPVVIAVQPNRDILRKHDLVSGELSHVTFATSSMTCARAVEVASSANINSNTIRNFVTMVLQ